MVEATVRAIAPTFGSSLKDKAAFLSQIETRFRFAIPSAHLDQIGSVDDAVHYTMERLEQRRVQGRVQAASWDRNLPPNVKLDLQGILDVDGSRRERVERYKPGGRLKILRERQGRGPPRHQPPAWVPREARGEGE